MSLLYIIYDKDGASVPAVLGVYDTLHEANLALTEIAAKMTDECLAGDPSDTGLDETDRVWLFKECRNSLGIQTLRLNTYTY